MSLPRNAPEVLAPAGDEECLDAAIKAGADAVYLGLQGFNARARATNFDHDALARSMDRLHRHGVRGYVTLNTLVFDAELPSLEAAVIACARAGVDAIIVQDLGVARLARAIAPSLAIHASTQMTCTDAGSVLLARELGAERIILARELSLDEIARIRAETDAELEVFVHGALCVAYSGQCLTSEAIGGRSANRGACAQACRLPYELEVDGVLQSTGDRAFLLSPEDLEASEFVPRLLAIGVSSLKIEGRLKGPAYVASTTRLYRRAVDAAMEQRPLDLAPDRARALQTFSRGSGPGFLAGVDHQRLVEGRSCDHRGLLVAEALGVQNLRGRPCLALRLAAPLRRGDGILVEGALGGDGELGGRVWNLWINGQEVEEAAAGAVALAWLGPERGLRAEAGRRVWKTSAPSVEAEIRSVMVQEPHRERLDLRLSGALGGVPRLEGRTARGASAQVDLDAPVQAAATTPLAPDVLRDKLGKLGDTPFTLGSLDLELPEGVTLPLSSLNRGRRALIAALEEGRKKFHTVEEKAGEELRGAAAPPLRDPAPGGLFVLCRTLEQAQAAVEAGADGVYLDFLGLTGTGVAFRVLREQRVPWIGLAPPRIRKPGEEKIDRYLQGLGPDGVLVRGLGALRSCAELGAPGIGDFSLNVTNRVTAAAVLERGLAAFTPSFDLDAGQLDALLSGPFAPWAEVVVHHPMPLFHMEHCVYAALLSEGRDHLTCGRPCEHHKVSVRDRAGMSHPVEADVGCRNTVFHAHPQSAAQLVPVLQRSGVRRFRIELVREDGPTTARLVETYRALLVGALGAPEVWRKLRVEGGYGVVRGSLRVLPS
jgi:putative protease